MSKPATLYAVSDAVTRRLPKGISPKGHAISDYLGVGMFAVAGALLWKTHRRAAVACLLCGGANLALNLMTDYPGGVVKLVNFPTHGKIDLGLAALTATMPEIAGFRFGRQFFHLHSGAMTVASNLTQFNEPKYPRRRPPAPFQEGN